MDFRPSSAQQLLVSTAREFLKKHCPPERAQQIALDSRGFDETLWGRMAELGWQGLLIPPDLGGSGGSLLDVIVLVEEMGRASTPGPFVPSAVVATALLLAAGSADHKKRLLPAMATGETIVSVALDDAGNTLVLDARGRLRGRALFVESAQQPGQLAVAEGVAQRERAGGLIPRADRRHVLKLNFFALAGVEHEFFQLAGDHHHVRAQRIHQLARGVWFYFDVLCRRGFGEPAHRFTLLHARQLDDSAKFAERVADALEALAVLPIHAAHVGGTGDVIGHENQQRTDKERDAPSRIPCPAEEVSTCRGLDDIDHNSRKN